MRYIEIHHNENSGKYTVVFNETIGRRKKRTQHIAPFPESIEQLKEWTQYWVCSGKVHTDAMLVRY